MAMKKIKWFRLNHRTLQARNDNTDTFVDNDYGLSESDIDPIQAWCVENNCGRRTSFDTFKFKNKEEQIIFLLKWS